MTPPVKSTSIFIISFLLLSSLGIATAQTQPKYKIDITHEIQKLCSLTAEQVAQVAPVVAAFEEKREAIYLKYRYNPAQLTACVKKNRFEYETNLIGILTPSQMGLLKVFDERNMGLMTYNSSQVISVNYLVDAQ